MTTRRRADGPAQTLPLAIHGIRASPALELLRRLP
jgi:hypothetical protein